MSLSPVKMNIHVKPSANGFTLIKAIQFYYRFHYRADVVWVAMYKLLSDHSLSVLNFSLFHNKLNKNHLIIKVRSNTYTEDVYRVFGDENGKTYGLKELHIWLQNEIYKCPKPLRPTYKVICEFRHFAILNTLINRLSLVLAHPLNETNIRTGFLFPC